jgi:hypothetical protein
MKVYYFLFLFLAIPVLLSAQKKIKVQESNENLGNGNNNALVVSIYEADKDLIEKSWKNLMKDFDAKVAMKREIFADNASIKRISDNPVDIYAKIEAGKDGENQLMVAFDLGGAFLSSSMHPDKYKEAKQILYNFAIQVTKEGFQEKLKTEEKNLSKMEKENENLIRTNDKLHKDIEDYKARITQAEKDIETNLKDQETKKQEIELQKKLLEEIMQKEKTVE